MNALTEIIMNNAETVLENTDIGALAGKTVLLTGASGLIGVHMLACMHKSPTHPGKVYAVTGRAPLPFVREAADMAECEILTGDLADDGFCADLPPADCIVHAAGYGQPIRFMENPIKTIRLNTLATLALFKKLGQGGRFLFVSTSEVYTGLVSPPFQETQIGRTDPGHPRSCYIEAKRCGEAIVNAYRRQGVDAKSARLALAYGPGTRLGDQRVISAFIQKALDGSITLRDFGQARRAFLYVTDAVEMMFKILLAGTDAVYNVGGVEIHSIAELARMVGGLAGVPVKYPDVPDPVKGGPQDAWLDMEKTCAAFDKNAFMPLVKGLEKTIGWYRLLQGSSGTRT